MIGGEREVMSTQVLVEGPHTKYHGQCLLLHLAVILLSRGQRFGGESNWLLSAIWSTLRNDSPDAVRRCIAAARVICFDLLFHNEPSASSGRATPSV